MFRAAFERVIAEYAAARDQPYASHQLAEFIRSVVPAMMAERLSEFPTVQWVGSAGRGGWADAPWFAAFDPIVTDTAQEGYYPVYLFTRSLDGLVLSLTQGMTSLRAELGTEGARTLLRQHAALLRARLHDQPRPRFSANPIDLQATGASTRLALYEQAHVFGIRYQSHELPTDDVLVADAREMLRLYFLATQRGGTTQLASRDDVVTLIPEPQRLEEARRFTLHRRIERNRRLSEAAKRIHGDRCQVCSLRFADVYGTLGDGYIEAHHRVRLADLVDGKAIALSPRDDFAVVCANCHRMLHRPDAPATFDDFRAWFAVVSRGSREH